MKPRKPTFKRWLENKDTAEVIAEDWGFRDCPVGKFLLEKYQYSPHVFYDTITYDNGDDTRVEIKSPKWIHDFSLVLDRVCGKHSSNDFQFTPVTAGMCLLILKDIQ